MTAITSGRKVPQHAELLHTQDLELGIPGRRIALCWEENITAGRARNQKLESAGRWVNSFGESDGSEAYFRRLSFSE